MSDALANNKLSQFALESPLGGCCRVVEADVDEDEEEDADVGASVKAALLSDDDKDEVD